MGTLEAIRKNVYVDRDRANVIELRYVVPRPAQ